MDPQAYELFEDIMDHIDDSITVFTNLKPQLDEAENLPPLQVWRLHVALTQLAELIAGPQARLYIEFMLRDDATRTAIVEQLTAPGNA